MIRTDYRAQCRHPVFLLNRLLSLGLLLDKIKVRKGELCFSVSYAQSKLADSLLSDMGVSFQKSGYAGGRALFFRLLSRPFLAASTVLALCGTFFFSNFVYGHSVKGNVFVNTAQVEEVLRQNGVDGFVSKKRLDLEGIKDSLCAIDGVSFASVKLVGNRLQVEIKEELPSATPDAPLYEPIGSLYSAVVTKIVAESGTPQVKSGDQVNVGDVLVAPIYAFTEGEAPAPARAEVWGIVTYQKEVLLPLYTVETPLTGKIFRTRSLRVFGKSVGKEKTPPFELYDMEERVIYRGAGVTVSEKTYRERASQTVYHDFGAEQLALIRAAVSDLLCSVPFYARERGAVRAAQKKLDNVLYIVLYYSVEQRIDSLFTAR